MKKFAILSLLALALSAQSQQLPMYLDETASLEARVEDALSRMTLEEKCRLSYAQSKFSSPGVPRLGIPELWMSDGPHGVRMEINWNDWGHSQWTNDSITAFPALTCLAATWDPSMSLLYGRSVGEEARYRKKSVLLGPGVNIYRTPLNGRNFEYMGEDPYLASQMCVPYIQGLQQNGVACCVKHYVLNDQEEFRGHIDVKVSDRALREIYLRPFEAAVKQGKAWSLMGSYNQYRDVHVSHNPWLLNQILKEEWGFDGAVITDWGACHDTREAALYGLDLEMGSYTNGLTSESAFGYDNYYLGTAYLEMAKRGEVPMEVVNDKARRMLRLLMRTEMMPHRPFGSQNTQEHIDACRLIGQEGIVLLKNDARRGQSALLPIQQGKYKKILVVGDNATRLLTQGGGSSELKARDEVSPLRAVQARYGSEAEVTYAQGYAAGPSMYGRIIELPQAHYDSLRQDAVSKARQADLVIFVGGLNKNHFQDCEGGDRLEYNLSFGQNQLIDELLAANPNTIVVIVSGNAYAMPWYNKVQALVQTWYIGSQSGPALVDILSGDVCPSGKTVFSYPIELEDCPAHQLGRVGYPGVRPDEVPAPYQVASGSVPASADLLAIAAKAKGQGLRQTAKTFPASLMERNTSLDGRTHQGNSDETEVYAEDVLVGYRWYDYHSQNGTSATKGARVRFPFGYGLSYTTFQYGKPTISGRTVSVDITNTGACEGKEVVQFYVGDDKASVIRPRKELKGFQKVNLKPGETKTVTYTLQDADLKFFDESSQQWVAEPGRFTIYVCASSADVRGKVSYDL